MNFERFKDRIIALIVISSISIFLLLLDSVGIVNSLYDLSSLLTVPVRLQLYRSSLKANDFLGVLAQISSLQEENQNLREENARLLEQLSELEECKYENEVLKEQLSLIEGNRDWILEGRVMGSNIAFESTLQINIGTQDGVNKGDIVVYGKYAVGKIIRAEKYSSKVLLITSPSSNIPAEGVKDRARGLVNGEVGLMLKMTNILPNERLEESEIIVTSGIESEFPSGFILGIVRKVDDNPAYAIQEAYIEAQLDFAKLDYIFVIKGQK